MQWDPLEESFSLLHWLEPLFAKLVLVHPYGENLLFIIHAYGETVLFVADEALAGGNAFSEQDQYANIRHESNTEQTCIAE